MKDGSEAAVGVVDVDAVVASLATAAVDTHTAAARAEQLTHTAAAVAVALELDSTRVSECAVAASSSADNGVSEWRAAMKQLLLLQR